MEERGRQVRIMDRMWALTFTPERALSSRRWRKLLTVELQEFAETIEQRFAAVEQGGHMCQIVSAGPSTDPHAAARGRPCRK